MRYFYKCGNNYLNLKSPINNPDYTEITEQEFNEANKPKTLTEKEISLKNKQSLIIEKRALLTKYKYDVEQVDLFGMERADYEEKKNLCKQLVLELRELEK